MEADGDLRIGVVLQASRINKAGLFTSLSEVAEKLQQHILHKPAEQGEEWRGGADYVLRTIDKISQSAIFEI